MNIEKIRKIADEVAIKLGLTVYSCQFTRENDEDTLEIEVDKPSFIDLDEITVFSETLNPLLDELPELDFPYTLDCHSADPEREITPECWTPYQGCYVELIDKKDDSYVGTFEADADEVIIQTFIKGHPKKWTIKKSDVKKISLRIKI